ncbi:MAG: PEP-CTERM sorting domain-containing protein [Gammaproteobacteria bacterium]|nr:PEP-CTERM sorting domain-containing protein [Gammaproteobacteria bacterium]
MKTLLAIFSLVLISTSAFASIAPVPEPGTLFLFAGAGITVLLLKILKK